jgi:hypothetical protein
MSESLNVFFQIADALKGAKVPITLVACSKPALPFSLALLPAGTLSDFPGVAADLASGCLPVFRLPSGKPGTFAGQELAPEGFAAALGFLATLESAVSPKPNSLEASLAASH